MIITLTPNPSLDHTLFLDRLVPGQVNRVVRSLTEPSGKGVNVSVALRRHGHPTVAVLPHSGASGTELLTLLGAEGLDVRAVHSGSSTPIRSNVSIVEVDGTTTKVNEAGLQLTGHAAEQLVAASVVSPGDWLAVCGSLPTGFGDAHVQAVIRQARSVGARVALDSSGAALARALAGPFVPDLIKPNMHELAELTSRRLDTLGDVQAAAGQVLERGVQTVLVSLGADGAVLVDRRGAALWGRASVDRVVNTAGAGDAFLAGYLMAVDSAPGADPRDRRRAAADLETALRFGAAAVQAHGTLLPADPGPPGAAPNVSIDDLKPNQLLSERVAR